MENLRPSSTHFPSLTSKRIFPTPRNVSRHYNYELLVIIFYSPLFIVCYYFSPYNQFRIICSQTANRGRWDKLHSSEVSKLHFDAIGERWKFQAKNESPNNDNWKSTITQSTTPTGRNWVVAATRKKIKIMIDNS